jgi:isopenicillin N synthase-like dioxygenase
MTDAAAPELEKRTAVAMAIRDACLNVGFFYVKNHGVNLGTVDATFAQSRTFFDQPAEVKKSVSQ